MDRTKKGGMDVDEWYMFKCKKKKTVQEHVHYNYQINHVERKCAYGLHLSKVVHTDLCEVTAVNSCVSSTSSGPKGPWSSYISNTRMPNAHRSTE